MRRSLLGVLALALMATACDDAFGPDGDRAYLVIQPRFAEQTSAEVAGTDPALRVDNVRVIIIDEAGDTVVDNVIEWPLDQDTLSLGISIEVTGQETFEFTLQGREGEEVLFQAVIPNLGLDAGSEEPVVVEPVLEYAGPEAAIETLEVTGPTEAFVAGATVPLTVLGTTADGSEVPDPLMVWTSLDTLAATVDSAGTVRVKHDGGREASIVGRVAFRSLADTVTLPVIPDTVIFLQEGDPIEALGAQQVINAHALGVTGDTVRNLPHAWSILDAGVVQQLPGSMAGQAFTVYALANGTANVVMSAGPFSDTVLVTVDQVTTAAAPVPSYGFIPLGQTVELSIEPLDANGFPVADADPPTWTPSDPGIVDVDAAGTATGLSAPAPVSAGRVTGAIEGASFDAWIDVQDGVSVGPAVDLSVGHSHSCWIESIRNVVLCRGSGGFGALGNGSLVDQDTVAQALNPFFSLAAGDAHTQISAGGTHTCAMMDTVGGAQALCWGDNRFGQLGDGTLTTRTQAVPVNTTVVGADLASVTVGGVHTCGLTAAGAAYCWGYNEFGQLGNGNAGTSSVTPSAVSGGHTFTQLVAGWLHSCGLKADGSVWCWGRGEEGELGDGTLAESDVPVQVNSAATFTQIEAGAAHTCGITAAGEVLCWGYDSSGQTGTGSPATEFIVASPRSVTGSLGVTAVDVAQGQLHGCLLTPAGEVYCWGANDQLQLGQGALRASTVPVRVPLSFAPTDIEAGGGQTCGMDGTRTICWGNLPPEYLGRATFTTPIGTSRLPAAFSLR